MYEKGAAGGSEEGRRSYFTMTARAENDGGDAACAHIDLLPVGRSPSPS